MAKTKKPQTIVLTFRLNIVRDTDLIRWLNKERPGVSRGAVIREALYSAMAGQPDPDAALWAALNKAIDKLAANSGTPREQAAEDVGLSADFLEHLQSQRQKGMSAE